MDGFEKISNNVPSFNYMETEKFRPVDPNTEIFLRKDGKMLSLGTLKKANDRTSLGSVEVKGVDGAILGKFGTKTIDDNLFIRLPSLMPAASAPAASATIGGRSRRFRRSRRSRRTRRSRK